ncbi:MAG: hypothetical protein WCD70_15700 [Alphaproteobacteria bacterium]
MPAVNWEDPFCETKANQAVPDLLVPERGAPRVLLRAIRQRQKPLLPYLEELSKAADEVVKRYRGLPGGDLLLSALKTQVELRVDFRIPLHPSLLREFSPMPLTCLPVKFPVSKKQGVPIFDQLLPTQKCTDFRTDGSGNKKPVLEADMELGLVKKVGISKSDAIPEGIKQAILAAEKEMGLMRNMALSSGEEKSGEQFIIVYPELLKFVSHWIKNIVSPISDLCFGEIVNPESSIRSGTANQPRMISSEPRPN